VSNGLRTLLKKFLLFVSSVFIVAMGQPAHLPFLGPLAAIFGFALIFRFLFDVHNVKKRFYWGTAWFFLVQLFQLYWSTSHPYAYIYPVWVICSAMFGAQFGLMAIFLTRQRIQSLVGIVFFPAFWVLMEWLRLFLFSGISWGRFSFFS